MSIIEVDINSDKYTTSMPIISASPGMTFKFNARHSNICIINNKPPVIIDDVNIYEFDNVPMLTARYIAAKQAGKTIVLFDDKVEISRSAFKISDGSTDGI